MTKKLDAVMEKVSGNHIITAIRRGLLQIVPLIIVGSFALVALNLPIPAYQDFMDGLFGGSWRLLGLLIYKGTYEIMSIAAVMSIAYAYCENFKCIQNGQLNRFSIVLCAICSYFAFNPLQDILIDANSADSRGMLGAIVVALVSTRLYVLFWGLFPGRRDHYSYDSDSLLKYSFRNVMPLLVVLLIFSLTRVLLGDVMTAATDGLMKLVDEFFFASGGGFVTMIAFVLVIQILWFFGLHGTNMLDAVAKTLFVTASDINISAAAAGEAPTQIITKQFIDCFVFIGGAGCTLGLIIALAVAGRKGSGMDVAKYSIFPGIFNINETLVYGLPIIFNPYYLVPFLLSPVLSGIISYAAFSLGLVPLTFQRVDWTTPVFLSGYVTTGSLAGVLLQLVCLVVTALLYLPFVRIYHKHTQMNNRRIFSEFSKRISPESVADKSQNVFSQSDEMGILARTLVKDVLVELGEEATGSMMLKYQPKVTRDGKVWGAEALLRWNHPVYGYIPPLVTTGLCEEADLDTELGTWVIDKAYEQLAAWDKEGMAPMSVSVNMSPQQLRDDRHLLDKLLACIKKTGIAPRRIELELTEHAAIDQSYTTRNRLEQIKEKGMNLSIDDFGMGNSSLMYIKDFGVNIIKIDISLVREILTNVKSQEIVRSIISLSQQLGIEVVAEGVETAEQRDKLYELGCTLYQGYYFSQAISAEEFTDYMRTNGVHTNNS